MNVKILYEFIILWSLLCKYILEHPSKNKNHYLASVYNRNKYYLSISVFLFLQTQTLPLRTKKNGIKIKQNQIILINLL